MADIIVKIIPAKPQFGIEKEKADSVIVYLKSVIVADEITVKLYEAPVFIDCGGNLEKIECPHCKEVIDFGWWSDAMDASWKRQFQDLSVILPCCNENASLNELKYHMPCGFSCVEFRVLNPLAELRNEFIAEIQQCLECPVRIIHART